MIRLKLCQLADQEHADAQRQYAHTLHHRNTICVARAFWKIPIEIQLGLLLHELGHLIDPDEDSELWIDRLASRTFGIHIHRVDTPYGNNLEYIASRNVRTAIDVLAEHISGLRRKLSSVSWPAPAIGRRW